MPTKKYNDVHIARIAKIAYGMTSIDLSERTAQRIAKAAAEFVYPLLEQSITRLDNKVQRNAIGRRRKAYTK